jgi:GNAT superfamily N-acetyltransferase
MSSSKTIILPDGSKCHKGANCQRHGTKAQTAGNVAKAEQLKTQIDSLFTSKSSIKLPPVESIEKPLPEWWNKYAQQILEKTVKLFQEFGVKKANIPVFHETAMYSGYIEVETEDKDTQLIVNTDNYGTAIRNKVFCRSWLYKQGKPVAMLRFATYRENYVPSEDEYQHIESVICDIEVHPDHVGKGYGMEIIRSVEKNILNGRLIHSGGSYTPEGRKALGGKLPYTHDAKTYDHREEIANGEIPAASFRSMKFIHDWDMLQEIR